MLNTFLAVGGFCVVVGAIKFFYEIWRIRRAYERCIREGWIKE
ncbi:hypothetical protein [Uliginosibacterium gangwonense]|nr:hypothetical protein [Uliginosibacterium gangwonense]